MPDLESRLQREADTIRAKPDTYRALAPQPLRAGPSRRQLAIIASLAASVLILVALTRSPHPTAGPQPNLVKNEQAYHEFKQLTQDTKQWAQQVSSPSAPPAIVQQLQRQLKSDRDTLQRLFLKEDDRDS